MQGPRFTLVLTAMLAVAGLGLGLSGAARPALAQSPASPHVPGTLDSTATHFQLTDSDWLNVALDSSEPAHLVLTSHPEFVTIVVLPAGGAAQAQMTLSGLPPGQEIHRYDDSHANHSLAVPDANGALSWAQDLASPHVVILKTTPSTVFLNDWGWDPPYVGSWDPGTRTATLSQDLFDVVEIRASDVTLEGSHHLIAPGSYQPWAVFVGPDHFSNITIRNLRTQAANTGVFVNSASPVTLENLDLVSQDCGVYLYYSPESAIRDVSVNAHAAVRLYECAATTVTRVTTTNVSMGIDAYVCPGVVIEQNNIYGRDFGISVYQSENCVVSANTVDSENQCLAVHASPGARVVENIGPGGSIQGISLAECPGLVFDGNSMVARGHAAALWLCDNSTITNNTLTGDEQPFYASNCADALIADNTCALTMANGPGVQLSELRRCVIRGNTFGFGMGGLHQLTDCRIEDNEFNQVSWEGLQFYGCQRDTVVANRVASTGRPLRVNESGNLFFYGNSFTFDPSWPPAVAGSTGPVTFNLPAPVGGNYWSPWTSPDNNADGFVDVPYVFEGGADQLPRTTPYLPGPRITASAGPGGSIDPAGIILVPIGGSQTFHFYPGTTYQIDKVLVDDVAVGAPPLYTFTNVTRDHTIAVAFKPANSPPVLDPVADRTMDEGTVLTFFATGHDNETPPHQLTYKLGAATPPWATINPTTGEVRLAPGEAEGPLNTLLVVYVLDTGTPPLSDSKSFKLTVVEVNQKPVLQPIPDATVVAGTPVVFTATAGDPDIPTNAIGYSLPVAPPGATVHPVTGEFYWVPDYSIPVPTDYLLTLRANDSGSPALWDDKSFTIHVLPANHPPVAIDQELTTAEDKSLAITLSGTDPDEDPLIFAVATQPTHGVVTGSPPDVTYLPAQDYYGIYGPDSFTFTVSDGHAQATGTVWITVLPANDPPTLDAIADQTVPEDAAPISVELTGVSPGPPNEAGQAVTLTAQSDNPAVVPHPVIVGSGSAWTLNFCPAAAANGTAVVAVTATDDGGTANGGTDVTQRTFVITVTPVNDDPVLLPVASQSAEEGGTVSFTAVAQDVDVGDVLTYSLGPGAPAGAEIDPSTGAFIWIPPDDGEFTIPLVVNDTHGGQDTGEALVSVANVAPVVTLTGPVSGSVYPVGTPVTFTGTFTDVGVADTHTAVWSLDGITADGVVTESAGSGTVSLTYVFPAAGVYLVSLAVTDDDGGVGTASQIDGLDAMIVVFDPTGGFVTGGGWIDSPAGAYVPDPALVGRANFGFVSKYKKGATVPTGETEFQFRTAGLNFKSTIYDWLVIAGARAQYKGAGTVNGAGDFGFLLTAVDGAWLGEEPDRFRVKIWSRLDGQLLYDNQIGAADSEDPTTVLGGGSITIHKSDGKGTTAPAVAGRPGVGSGAVPQTCALHQNRPNPFSDASLLVFDLSERSQVRLAVYDVTGREVARPVDEVREAGSHAVSWSGIGADGSHLPAGIYFCRMTAHAADARGEFTAMRRMTVLK